jgi:hypothetical protein
VIFSDGSAADGCANTKVGSRVTKVANVTNVPRAINVLKAVREVFMLISVVGEG